MPKSFYEQKCRICGCDWNHACNDHDYWFAENLCSACAEEMKPILFNTPMVQAIQDDRKTNTRRVIKPKCRRNFIGTDFRGQPMECRLIDDETQEIIRQTEPPYEPGDILYVRETWRIQSAHRFEADAKIEFKASGPMQKIQFANSNSQSTSRDDYDEFVGKWWNDSGKWHPSIHMPKEAARIFLRVTGVRAERLQEIDEYWSNYDKEGMRNPETENIGIWMQEKFISIWDSTVKKVDLPLYGWAANPWVWTISFQRI